MLNYDVVYTGFDKIASLLALGEREIRPKNKEQTKQTNSVALVRKRAIPTERPPLVGEVSEIGRAHV
jgi:hypothetical protein